MTNSPALLGKVVYQIYPRSFYDGNGDGVGDLPGIIEKLDYLNNGRPGSLDSLGINMIWLSPFYPSPMADFGYDISDYCDVDPLFGTLADFKRLVSEAQRRGIQLMIDFVPSHTSDQHPWFVASRSSRSDAKRDWYIWRDGAVGGGPPNNWLSVFGGSAWQRDEASGQYYMHSFLAQQPDLNWDNPEVRAAMKSAMRFWLDLGVTGIRVDAVDWMAKDRAFRDNPVNRRYRPGADDPYHAFDRIYSQNAPQLTSYLREMAAVVKEYPGGFMVTETYPDRRNIVAEYLKLYDQYLTEVSAPFNFEGIMLPWSAPDFKAFVDQFQAGLQPGHLPIYVLGNHDNSRVASRIGRQAARTAAMMLLTLPGVAFVYYGDELGMEDVAIPPDRIQDPFERRVPGLGLGRDPNRTPMQWSAAPQAGFTGREPWLPVAPNYAQLNAAAEAADPASVLWEYRRLIHLRNTSPALQGSEYEPLELGHPAVFGYVREHGGQRLVVLLNFSDQAATVHTELGRGLLLCAAQSIQDHEPIGLSEVVLPPHEGYVIAITSS
ncbi:MAG TPA: alpha-amylase family glycosyl hydrolase [Candidatus Saccharimonadia bacterium]|nr:alpha-amylase family glycosyl hydrolase [Candidatus Saccharimonadia bacterium]